MRHLSLEDISVLAREAKGQIDRIFLHWSAGHYGQPFPDYHINIDADGTLWTNAASLTEQLAHTWQQNTRSIGVSLLCCFEAVPENLGSEPPTALQIETTAQVVALLCRNLELPIDAKHVRTHAEQANIDEYGPYTSWERWDLWILATGDEPGTGGDILRGKAHFYRYGELAAFP